MLWNFVTLINIYKFVTDYKTLSYTMGSDVACNDIEAKCCKK